MRKSVIVCLAAFLFVSCQSQRKLNRSARELILDKPELRSAHIGICVFDPLSGKYLYQWGDDKYFVPASNTKIPTCYAAMKYLGDSLPGLRVSNDGYRLYIEGTGDPSFLHPDFSSQPVFDYLRSMSDSGRSIYLSSAAWKTTAWGSGWSWSDYDASYMPERSAFPIYGNVATFRTGGAIPKVFSSALQQAAPGSALSRVDRSLHSNEFRTTYVAGAGNRTVNVPFITSDSLTRSLLGEAVGRKILEPTVSTGITFRTIRSRPTDSLLKPMMHHSDNLFAEQSLLMAGYEFLGEMNERKLIDTLLKTDFSDLPHAPRWVDGSGLSRYNLFTPRDMVFILDKMRRQFGMERIRNIFATGGEGTLSSYYQSEKGFIFAKTGTLSGVVALSGFLFTSKNRLLIFSVLVNNHQTSATEVRRSVESFLKGLR